MMRMGEGEKMLMITKYLALLSEYYDAYIVTGTVIPHGLKH